MNFFLLTIGNSNKKRISNFIILFVVFLFPFNLYCSYKYYSSYVDQAYLIPEYNQRVFNRPIEEIEKIQYTFPNITASTLPIADILGMYHLSYGQENKALELYREGIKANPYLGGSEALISDIYFNQNKNDSAIYYGKKSWEKLPRNAIHFAYYVSALSRIRDTLKIEEAFANIPNRNPKESEDHIFDDIYLAALADVIDIDVQKKYIKDLNEQIFSKKDFMKINLYFLNFGKEQVLKAEKIYNKGMTFFDQKDFHSAAPLLEEAAKLNSLQNAYFENAGNAYLKIKNYDKSLEMLNFVIDSLKPKTGKAQYLKALVYLNQSEDQKACQALRESVNLGFKPAEKVLGYFCYK